MMTRIKLNYYRAEEEMLIMERIRWRREAEQRRKQWKKTEKEIKKLRAQGILIISFKSLSELTKFSRRTRSGERDERMSRKFSPKRLRGRRMSALQILRSHSGQRKIMIFEKLQIDLKG